MIRPGQNVVLDNRYKVIEKIGVGGMADVYRGYDELLAENPYLKASLDYRMPYFNILNYIQLELIKRQRRGELSSDQEKLIHTTINGIATGLRNSG